MSDPIEVVELKGKPGLRAALYADETCDGPHEWGDECISYGSIEFGRGYRGRDFSELLAKVREFIPAWDEGDEDAVRASLIADGLISADNTEEIQFGQYGRVWCGEERFDEYAYRFDPSDLESIESAVTQAGGHFEYASTQYSELWVLVPPDKASEFPEGIKSAIQEFKQWAEGECYGIVIERECPECGEWEATDESCWGFIGWDYAKEMLEGYTVAV